GYIKQLFHLLTFCGSSAKSLCFSLVPFRRESYGPLLESSDYGTLGNFSNPMYDP
uniref:Uncharacterized protein n=1 Tax=Nothobranchius furzeri TaxID=105023 RepID=A0A8C6KLE0_NOTFU